MRNHMRAQWDLTAQERKIALYKSDQQQLESCLTMFSFPFAIAKQKIWVLFLDLLSALPQDWHRVADL